MAGHGNRHHHSSRINLREDLYQSFSRCNGLKSPRHAILVLEEALSYGIGEGHDAVVHESDMTHSPTHETARHSTAKSAGSEQQTAFLR